MTNPATQTDSPSKPLEGVLVVSIEQAVAAPLASCRLADAGARVIKVERPEGDFARHFDSVVNGMSAYFVWLNRGKESLVADLKDPDDVALVREILSRADVFIQNLAPGTAQRLGLGSAELRQRHPRLVTCDISGYGAEGPRRSQRAYDLLVQAESGVAAITGSPEEPGRVGVSVCDLATGIYAYSAILEALIERNKTGRGSAVEASLFHTMADWMTVPLLHHDEAGLPWPRVGLAHPTIAPYGVYPVDVEGADGGSQVLIGVQNDDQFARLCRIVLLSPDLATDERFATNAARNEHRRELDVAISEVFGRLSRSELLERLDVAGVAYGFVNDVSELSQHPQLRRVEQPVADGVVSMVEPAPRRGAVPRELGEIPRLGQHSDALRREFG